MTAPVVVLDAAQRSEQGPRASNQDSVLCRRLPDGAWLAAVADGMGGLDAGELASRTALEALERSVKSGRSLARAVRDANAAVISQASGDPMGTTLVAVLMRGAIARLVNVGDSRGYLAGSLGVQQLTQDHTVRAEAARSGAAAGRDAAHSRWSDSLTRSLGGKESVEVDEFGPLTLAEGERLVLCSDGVHSVLSSDAIEGAVMGFTARQAADRLVESALEQGSEDNVSAVVVLLPAAEKESAATRSPSTPPWDPAQLVKRSGRSLKRKPGVPSATYLVLALVAIAVAIGVLLR